MHRRPDVSDRVHFVPLDASIEGCWAGLITEVRSRDTLSDLRQLEDCWLAVFPPGRPPTAARARHSADAQAPGTWHWPSEC